MLYQTLKPVLPPCLLERMNNAVQYSQSQGNSPPWLCHITQVSDTIHHSLKRPSTWPCQARLLFTTLWQAITLALSGQTGKWFFLLVTTLWHANHPGFVRSVRSVMLFTALTCPLPWLTTVWHAHQPGFVRSNRSTMLFTTLWHTHNPGLVRSVRSMMLLTTLTSNRSTMLFTALWNAHYHGFVRSMMLFATLTCPPPWLC